MASTIPAAELAEQDVAPEVCDAVREDYVRCEAPADVELIVLFPCGTDQLRALCAPHARATAEGQLNHQGEGRDHIDTGVIVASWLIGGAA